MGPQKIILHIGAPKTGTTAIQDVIKENFIGFEKAGVDTFPSLLNNSGRSLLAELFINRERDKDVFKAANSTLSASKKRAGLISSEVFWGRNPKLIAECFPALRASHVVMYVREQTDLILTHYRQKLKNRNFSMSPREFFRSHWRDYDYDFQAERWSSAFSGRLSIRVYTKSLDVVNDFFQDFCPKFDEDIFDPKGSALSFPKSRSNPSQDGFEAYSRVFFNGGNEQLHLAQPLALRRVRDGLEEPRFDLSEDLKREISETYADSNNRVMEHFFQNCGRPTLF